MSFRVIASMILLASLFAGASYAQSGYAGEIAKWRADHQAELLTDDGWMTVAGLFWLKEGVNTVGAGDKYDVQLTANFKQGKLGEITLTNGVATLKVEPGVTVTHMDKPVTSIELVDDVNQKQTVVAAGGQRFFLIRRPGKFGIRLRDLDNPARTQFKGLKWFPVDRSMRVTATLEAFPAEKDIDIDNVLGGTFKMKSPGVLKFKLAGKEYTLQPVMEGERLFIIFRDLTFKKETYGAGRFLYADMAVDGKVILDFNKAENPPCAYTEFATCPLPPRQNRLETAIRAGEKRYHP